MYLDWFKILKAVKDSDKCCLNCLQKDFERDNGSCSFEDFRKMLRGTKEADHIVLGYLVNKIGCSLSDIQYIEDKKHILPEELKKIAREYDIILRRDLENGEKNTASSAGDEIFLNDFDDSDNERFAFFHELAHIIGRKLIAKGLNIENTPSFSFSTISDEGLCWEIALIIAKKYGYSYEYACKEHLYALKQYSTYLCENYINEVKEGNLDL